MQLSMFRSRPRRRHSELDKLAEAYGSDKGWWAPNRKRKWMPGHAYTRVYSSYMAPLRDRRITLLEIGLQRPMGKQDPRHGTDAPSLRMWRSYLRHAILVGFDRQKFSGVDLSDCTIVQGDQGSEADLNRAIAVAAGGFDVVIDDGSHASVHQQTAFGVLFPHVRPGGLYFIEDLQWQPAELERSDIPKTADVFARFRYCGKLASPVWSETQSSALAAEIGDLRFYDSLAEETSNTDALMAVRKA